MSKWRHTVEGLKVGMKVNIRNHPDGTKIYAGTVKRVGHSEGAYYVEFSLTIHGSEPWDDWRRMTPSAAGWRPLQPPPKCICGEVHAAS